MVSRRVEGKKCSYFLPCLAAWFSHPRFACTVRDQPGTVTAAVLAPGSPTAGSQGYEGLAGFIPRMLGESIDIFYFKIRGFYTEVCDGGGAEKVMSKDALKM